MSALYNHRFRAVCITITRKQCSLIHQFTTLRVFVCLYRKRRHLSGAHITCHQSRQSIVHTRAYIHNECVVRPIGFVHDTFVVVIDLEYQQIIHLCIDILDGVHFIRRHRLNHGMLVLSTFIVGVPNLLHTVLVFVAHKLKRVSIAISHRLITMSQRIRKSVDTCPIFTAQTTRSNLANIAIDTFARHILNQFIDWRRTFQVHKPMHAIRAILLAVTRNNRRSVVVKFWPAHIQQEITLAPEILIRHTRLVDVPLET
mmetsp:Transcript_55111/g.91496  ORF Transcript_55111/g.91496 Transcript_55111/m.91496 type:complete len:257 (-) Transcript_55111:755-1525(-)